MKEIKKETRKRVELGIGIIACIFSIILILAINNNQTKKESTKKEDTVALKQKEEVTIDDNQEEQNIIQSEEKSKTDNESLKDITTHQNKISEAEKSKSQSKQTDTSKAIKSDSNEKKKEDNAKVTTSQQQKSKQAQSENNTQEQTESNKEESIKTDKPIIDNSEPEVTWTMTAEEMKNYARSYIESRGFLYEENGTGYNNPITIYKGYSQDKIKGRIKEAIDYLVDVDKLDPESSAIGCIVEQGTDFYRIKIVY